MNTSPSGSDDSSDTSTEWSRREAVKAMGAAGLASLAPRLSAGAPDRGERPSAPDRPNIIFVLTDDQTLRGLSCYGSTLMETPNLDRIAEEGMRFDNAFVTNSLCAPSRASMLTGKYSHEHGTTENIFRDKEPFDASQMTFPKRLRNAGYTTLQIGKWHLESHPTGFDYWKRLPNQGRYKVPVFPEKPEGGGEPMRIQESGYITDIITELLDYLDETGLAKNTLLVFASDQGIFIGEHGYYDKRPMYEESIRLPLLMRYPPLIPAGTVEARIVRNIDFAAAFMDRAGVEISDDVQGRNL